MLTVLDSMGLMELLVPLAPIVLIVAAAAGILELAVVAAEYLVYRSFLFQDRSAHPSLLAKTLAANILSCGIGILIELGAACPM